MKTPFNEIGPASETVEVKHDGEWTWRFFVHGEQTDEKPEGVIPNWMFSMSTEQERDLDFYLKLPYTIVLRRDEDGDVVGKVEELPGCVAHGTDELEAINNLRDMQRLWIESCIENRQTVPAPASLKR